MDRLLRFALVAAAVAAVMTAFNASAEARFDTIHSFDLHLTARDASGNALGTNHVTGTAPVSLSTSPIYENGGLQGTNPLYESSNAVVVNPLYNEPTGGGVNPLFGAKLLVSGVKHLHQEGIIHRDLAARLVVTGAGGDTFGGDVVFNSDGPLFADDKIPVRWSAPEVLLSRESNLLAPDSNILVPVDHWTLDAGSSFTVTVVPEPTTLASIAGLALVARRRR